MRKMILIAVSAVFLLTSCEFDMNMETTVHKDGSITRRISSRADSTFLCGGMPSTDPLSTNASPIVPTDEWALTWSEKGSVQEHAWPMSSEKYQSYDEPYVNMKRTFASARDMSEKFQFDIMPVKPKSTFSKRFKWFYTDYEFTETFPQPEFSIPLSDYLGMEEALSWFRCDPDFDGLNGAFYYAYLNGIGIEADKWLTANIVNDIYQACVEFYDSIRNAPLPLNEFEARKVDFISWVTDGILTPQHTTEPVPFGYDEVLQLMDDYFETDAFTESHIDFCDEYADSHLLASRWYQFQYTTFDYTVVMPGKPVPQYGTRINGHAQTFAIVLNMIYPEDYTITVQSRAANVWAWIISVLIILVAIGSLTRIPLLLRRKE